MPRQVCLEQPSHPLDDLQRVLIVGTDVGKDIRDFLETDILGSEMT